MCPVHAPEDSAFRYVRRRRPTLGRCSDPIRYGYGPDATTVAVQLDDAPPVIAQKAS